MLGDVAGGFGLVQLPLDGPLLSLPAWVLELTRLPVRILAGDSDGLTPAERARPLHELLPGSLFEVLASCGHQLMLERPQIVTRHLRELLTALPAGDRVTASHG
ncbi:alpha/beta fold hydrolase [Pseudomonas panipatensis]|uniref:alpha/beta fold hydrolase n=1 Tax=Pseudomonas panipatensis TaxID=428992 RepID=UPI000B7CC72E|nr:alpha/beta hydrolase [Pseudomonas panipatensis]